MLKVLFALAAVLTNAMLGHSNACSSPATTPAIVCVVGHLTEAGGRVYESANVAIFDAETSSECERLTK